MDWRILREQLQSACQCEWSSISWIQKAIHLELSLIGTAAVWWNVLLTTTNHLLAYFQHTLVIERRRLTELITPRWCYYLKDTHSYHVLRSTLYASPLLHGKISSTCTQVNGKQRENNNALPYKKFTDCKTTIVCAILFDGISNSLSIKNSIFHV